MNDKKNKHGNLLPDNDCLFWIGRVIRKTTFDGHLRLINVLIGHMSLVVSRSLLLKYIPLYSEEQRRRHPVKPCITGWAQINGGRSISTEKSEKDIYCINHFSFILYLKIILLTIMKVLIQEEVEGSESRPMESLFGSN